MKVEVGIKAIEPSNGKLLCVRFECDDFGDYDGSGQLTLKKDAKVIALFPKGEWISIFDTEHFLKNEETA